MKEEKVAIIIVTWNGIEDTMECLESLKGVTYKNFRIIVIDNASHDGSVSRIQKKYPEIQIVENNQNLGFAPAVNIGIECAQSQHFKYALLLNNDTIVDKDFLTILVKTIEKKPDNGIVGSKIYYFNSDKILWFAGGAFTPSDGLFRNIGQQEKDLGQVCETEVDFVSGCSMLFRIDILKVTGLLNEKYESYVEDVEFNLRAKDSGYKIVLAPSSVVWHKVSKSSGGEVNTKKTFLKVRNSIFFGNGYLYNRFGIISYLYIFKYVLIQLLRSVEQRSIANFLSVIRAIPAGIFTNI